MITITHTSPDLITEIDQFGGCTRMGVLFFSNNDYSMCKSVNAIYDLDLNDDEIISVSRLYDEEIVNEIIEDVYSIFNNEISEEDAEGLLDASLSIFDIVDDYDRAGEFDWKMQGYQAVCARKMGYIACEGFDENGAVWMIKMDDNLLARMQLRN